MRPIGFGESIVIVRGGVRDRFGDRVAGPGDAQVDGVGFAFDAGSTTWPQDGEDRSVADCTLYLPSGTDIRKGDKVKRLFDGSMWHVVGGAQWTGVSRSLNGWDPGYFTQRIREVI